MPIVPGLCPRSEYAGRYDEIEAEDPWDWIYHTIHIHATMAPFDVACEIAGCWPPSHTETVLNQSMPGLAPWLILGCTLQKDAYKIVAAPVYAYAAELHKMTVTALDALVKYARSVEGNWDGPLSVTDAETVKTVLYECGRELFGHRPWGNLALNPEKCGVPLEKKANDPGVEYCNRCGTAKSRAVSTEDSTRFRCPGRIEVRIHDNARSDAFGGILIGSHRFSLWWYHCSEVFVEPIQENCAQFVAEHPGTGGRVVVDGDGNCMTISKPHSYNRREHIRQRIMQSNTHQTSDRLYHRVVSNRLCRFVQMCCKGNTVSDTRVRMQQLLHWSGHTIPSHFWKRMVVLWGRHYARLIESCVSLSVEGACLEKDVEDSDYDNCNTTPRRSGREDNVRKQVLAEAAALLQARIEEMDQSKSIERVTMTDIDLRNGGLKKQRLSVEVLAQYAAASLGIPRVHHGKVPSYEDANSRVQRLRNELLLRLTSAAKQLGWPLCVWNPERKATRILFLRETQVDCTPIIDKIKYNLSLYSKETRRVVVTESHKAELAAIQE